MFSGELDVRAREEGGGQGCQRELDVGQLACIPISVSIGNF